MNRGELKCGVNQVGRGEVRGSYGSSCSRYLNRVDVTPSSVLRAA